MKRTLCLVISLLLLVSGASVSAAAPSVPGIAVTIDGKKQSFSSAPVMKNGSVMVPFRNLFEALGATIQYDPATKTITATKDQTTVILQIGSKNAKIDGEDTVMAQTPFVEKGVTYVSARFVSESLGGMVEWDSVSRTVIVKTAKAVEGDLKKVIARSDVTPEQLKPLLNPQNSDYALLLALQYNRSNAIIDVIIAAGSASDFTLMNAISHRHKYAVEALLKLGVSPNATLLKDMPLLFSTENWKVSAFDAAGNSVKVDKPVDLEIVQLLLDYGAEKTPDILANAVKYSFFNHEVVLFLLESGFDPNAIVFQRVFVSGTNIQFYDLSLDDTIREKHGEHYVPILVTASEVASWNPDMVAMKNVAALVEHGADLSVLSQDLLDRLLYLAKWRELDELVQALQAAGAKAS
ncbi:stalk domain-containing protein [Paenibacillus sp. LHD-117]|uniref:stalk domain-containing protein n=1 Tax=Paenibacillus sp. LHD-117 TaxID=3071412 RepID=UPI0027DFEBD1|nr:stalk domain-containing protein [Paenibacillus sp. LHD-117]MDQ6422198.1 stalk domain-containing protein [Paenibacillus sp. LHD-117]